MNELTDKGSNKQKSKTEEKSERADVKQLINVVSISEKLIIECKLLNLYRLRNS